jgi:tRNA-(ms[2]io[6]A)-hydroxylase
VRLRFATPAEWSRVALEGFDAFLLDHAACERKAAASAKKLAAQHPDRVELAQAMRALALEEEEHYRRVRALADARGLGPTPYYRDPYVAGLQAAAREDPAPPLLARLLLCGIIEARACERLGLVAGALSPGDLRDFYRDLTRSEARHHALFVRLAMTYFPRSVVEERQRVLLAREAVVMRALPLRPAIH